MTTYSGRDFWREHPTKWLTVPLRKVAKLGTGHTPSRSVPEYWENCTIPWLTTEDLTSRRGLGPLDPVMQTRQLISELGLAHSAAELHPADTVMLSRTASVGHVARVGKPMATTQAFVTWTCSDALDPRYLTAVLLAMNPEYFRLAYGSTHLTIYMPDIEQLRVPLPPLEEQRAIADYLDVETARIDALIGTKQQLIHVLEERWQSVVSHRVWGSTEARIRLKYLTGLPSSGNRDHGSFTEDDSGVPCLRGLNIRPARLDLSNLRYISEEDHARQVQTQLQVGDIVIVRSGLAGAAVSVPPELQPCNCVDLVVVRRSTHVDSRFVEYVINSREAQEQVAQSSAGALLTHFNAVDAGDLSIPHLPVARQRLIAEGLDRDYTRQRSIVSALVDQIKLLNEHRQAMVTAAVTAGVSRAA